MYRSLWISRRNSRSFPRTRGDVPDLKRTLQQLGVFPPHTRGCTLDPTTPGPGLDVSPAHAGMYPSFCSTWHLRYSQVSPAHAGMYRGSCERTPPGSGCFPRTRGDVPGRRGSNKIGSWFPPHTRGCTGVISGESLPQSVSPAHAGMYPGYKRIGRTPRGFPRTRGDVPMNNQGILVNGTFPPHTRGCTPSGPGGGDSTGVSPAHAGMYRHWRGRTREHPGFPRTRGDVPHDFNALGLVPEFPPHTRGCTLGSIRLRERVNVSPAHAGMYRIERLEDTRDSSFPRTRGDVPLLKTAQDRSSKFPPHTRGCTSTLLQLHPPITVSPAHAGMYPNTSSCSRRSISFPRTRGDVPFQWTSIW